MTTATQYLPIPPPARRPRVAGPLLILGGQGSSIGGALRVAEALARRDEVHTHLLGVSRPRPPVVSPVIARPADRSPAELHDCRYRSTRSRARRKGHQAVGRSAPFGTGGAVGQTEAVATAARVRQAEYILAGLPPAGTAAGRSGGGSVARLAHAAGVPVLGVRPDQSGLPGRALVWLEPGEPGMRAACAALALLDLGGTLILVEPPGEAEGPRQFTAILGGLAGVKVDTCPRASARLADLVRVADLVVTSVPPPGPTVGPPDHDPLLRSSAGCVLVLPVDAGAPRSEPRQAPRPAPW
jgi:hypothetical protein